MKIAIQGVGVLGGFGCGMDALGEALSTGRCTPQSVSVKTGQGSREMHAFLADTSRLEEFVNKRALRRVDHYSKMALLGSYLAFQDAGKLDADRTRMGIIVATGYGAGRTTFAFLDSFINDGDNFSLPTHFSNSVHNAAVANISILLGITGPGLTVSQFEMSVPSALLVAKCWLEEGRVDSVLFGGVDEYSDVLGYCWHRFFDNKKAAAEMKPLDFGLQTAIPGEGAAFFLLTGEAEGPSRYGFIDDIVVSRCTDAAQEIPEGATLIVGADGHKACAAYYRQCLPESSRIACYSPLYGSLPVGPAFDLAVGTLSIKNGTIFRNQETPTNGNAYVEEPLGVEKINCVKISTSGEMGSVVLAAAP